MKRIICLALCLCWAVAFAQKAPQEVTLVVSADGATKTQAIDNALRSAIEQTFGTFVSANTEILNDELVKDEIATVSSGNIQKYSEIAAVTLPNGNTSVTLNVTVSLSKLVSYAQSKGSECEFAGATFGANLRMYEFNKRSEQIAIQNMIKQLDALRPVFDYEIEVSDPVLNDDGKTAKLAIMVKAKANEKTKMFNEIIEKTFMSLAMKTEQIQPMVDAGFKYGHYVMKKNDNTAIDFFLYDLLPDSLSLFIPSTLWDFVITDNIGGKYVNEYRTDVSHNFGYLYCLRQNLLLNLYDSYYEMLKARVDEQPYQIVIEDNEISGVWPLLEFEIPLDCLYKISKVEISPIKKPSSNVYYKEGHVKCNLSTCALKIVSTYEHE